MNLRRIFALVIIVSVLLTSCLTAFAENMYLSHLESIGINTDTLSASKDELILRDEFAYLVSKLISGEERQPIDTKFSDVSQGNSYSGYIYYLVEHGIINGVSDTIFNPAGYVSRTDAVKIIIGVLGYESWAKAQGGYPDGYLKIALHLGLFDDLNGSGEKLTRGDTLKILGNALLTKDGWASLVVSGEDNSIKYNDTQGLYLTSRLSYSVYKGVITACNQLNTGISFYVTSNEFDSNFTVLKTNTTVNFIANGKIDFMHYKNTPVTIWVNADGYVVYVHEQNGYEIKYGYVSTVNGDSSQNNSYRKDQINRLTIEGDEVEYKLASDVELNYYGTTAEAECKLTGSFVRMVTKNKKILYLAGYQMQRGGLIQKINDKKREIVYIKGESVKQRLRNLDEVKRLSVYIDGKSAVFSELKENSVFDYYLSDDYAIICASERTAVDIFKSFSHDEIEIGAFLYDIDDCYFSIDGINYKMNIVITELLNCEVTSYFAPNGKAAYVAINNGESKINNFYGIVSGVAKQNDLQEESYIKLFKIGDPIKEKIYTITAKTKFSDNLSLETLKSTVKNLNGDGIYYFTANQADCITKVAACKPFSGYADNAKKSFTSFVDDGTPYVTIGDKNLYFIDTDIIGIYESAGEFTVGKLKWNMLSGLGAAGTATFSFYSDEDSPNPDIAVLTCNLANITRKEEYFGIVTKISSMTNDDGNDVCGLEVLMRTGSKKYMISKATASNLSLHDFVSFYEKVLPDKEEIIISKVTTLAGGMDHWVTSSTNTSGFQKGVVRRIDDKRLYLEGDNVIYYMHPYSNFIVSVNDIGSKNRFSLASVTDINVGDIVFYNLYSGDIKGIFVAK